MKIIQDHKNWDEIAPKGLVDGGNTVVYCSNCRAPLVQILVTQPDINFTTSYKAKCCWCNDKSFIVKIKGGGICLGHTEYSQFVDFAEEGECTIIQTHKGDKVWQPKR